MSAPGRTMGQPGRIQWSDVDMVATDEMMRSYTETQMNRLLAIFASDYPAEFLEALHTLERREQIEQKVKIQLNG